MKKLFYLYTNPRFLEELYTPVMKEAFDRCEDVQVSFVLDTSILDETLQNGAIPTPGVQKRMKRIVENCVEAGADCIVVGCTAVNLATEELRKRNSIPIISVDRPMIQEIVRDGRRKAAVLSHSAVNAKTVGRMLESCGIKHEVFVTDHFLETALGLSEEFDAIALGHITADRIAFDGVKTPIYRSGVSCVKEIKRVLGGCI